MKLATHCRDGGWSCGVDLAGCSGRFPQLGADCGLMTCCSIISRRPFNNSRSELGFPNEQRRSPLSEKCIQISDEISLRQIGRARALSAWVPDELVGIRDDVATTLMSSIVCNHALRKTAIADPIRTRAG